MKKLLTAIIVAFMPFVYANAQKTVVNETHERVLNHVKANIYDVSFLNQEGQVVQKGQYWKEGERFIPHGTWVLFAQNSNQVVTKSKFEKGKQVWVETNINGKTVKADEKQLAISKLENRIAKLEKEITELKNQ